MQRVWIFYGICGNGIVYEIMRPLKQEQQAQKGKTVGQSACLNSVFVCRVRILL